MSSPIVVGITGASGAVYAVRLLEVLRSAGRDVHLSISPSGRDVLEHELGLTVDLEKFEPASLLNAPDEPNKDAWLAEPPNSAEPEARSSAEGTLHYYHHHDFMAPMASGSFLSAGMVICPASGTTLSAVAAGAAENLIQRAAEVHLKERRKLILVPREAPLSLAHIANMQRVTLAGGIILPASPGFYGEARTVNDLVNFVVARICDQLGVEHDLTKRWGSE